MAEPTSDSKESKTVKVQERIFTLIESIYVYFHDDGDIVHDNDLIGNTKEDKK